MAEKKHLFGFVMGIVTAYFIFRITGTFTTSYLGSLPVLSEILSNSHALNGLLLVLFTSANILWIVSLIEYVRGRSKDTKIA